MCHLHKQLLASMYMPYAIDMDIVDLQAVSFFTQHIQVGLERVAA